MRIHIEAFGFKFDRGSAQAKDPAPQLTIENGASLAGHLTLPEAQLNVNTSDKTILVNGAYLSPSYALQVGDRVQILRMLNGG